MADSMSPEDEVKRLHDDLQVWIGQGDASRWATFESALADDFVQIGPDGVARDRATVLDLVAGLKGIAGPTFVIEIKEAKARTLGGGYALVSYREVQRGGSRDTDRWSSALLGRSSTGAWRWHHLHECWAG
ncbi:MAG: DUF4440 domain-containing protein [Pseudomonadota bacterium]